MESGGSKTRKIGKLKKIALRGYKARLLPIFCAAFDVREDWQWKPKEEAPDTTKLRCELLNNWKKKTYTTELRNQAV